MRKTFSLLILALLPFVATAQIQYQVLAPLPSIEGYQNIDNGGSFFSSYLNNLYMLGVALCTALAVLMIVVGGVQWASSDAWSKKAEGKERIWAAVLGLLIALGSWVIVNTISPEMLNTDLKTSEVVNVASLSAEQLNYVNTGITQDAATNPLTPSGTPGVDPSGNMAQIPNGIDTKAGNQVDSSLVPGLQNMNSELDSKNIGWRVTEAWPPTREHKNPCHQNGTCVDANFTDGTPATAANVSSFISAANNNGFNAVYEVRTQEEKNSLTAGGVPSQNVQVLGGWISASHFSVYNKK